MANLYRKSSLDKLSSPDRLDCMLTVTSPLSWLGIVVAFVLCTVVIIWSFVGSIPNVIESNGIILEKTGVNSVFSERMGIVENVMVKEGDSVKVGTAIAKIRNADNSIYTVLSDQVGKITDVYISTGSPIYAFSEVIRVMPQTINNNIVVCYIPLAVYEKVVAGMEVKIFPVVGDVSDSLKAKVLSVDKYAASTQGLCNQLGQDGQLASMFTSNGPVIVVSCEIVDDDASKLETGEIINCQFITSEDAPITKVFPSLGR